MSLRVALAQRSLLGTERSKLQWSEAIAEILRLLRFARNDNLYSNCSPGHDISPIIPTFFHALHQLGKRFKFSRAVLYHQPHRTNQIVQGKQPIGKRHHCQFQRRWNYQGTEIKPESVFQRKSGYVNTPLFENIAWLFARWKQLFSYPLCYNLHLPICL